MKRFTILILLLIQFAAIGVYARSVAIVKSKTLAFRENKGQVVDQFGNPRPDVQFQVLDKEVSMFVGNGQLHYQFNKQLSSANNKKSIKSYRLDVELIGANENATVFTEEPKQGVDISYTAGMEAVKTHSYRKLTYQNVYPNIDWVLYIKDSKVEYDFVVKPGGDPASIRLQYGGATALKLKNGAITARTPLGKIIEDKPYSYVQETKSKVESRFTLQGNTVGFATAKHEGTLVIDPVVNWATFYGDVDNDYGAASCADSNGNVYLTGFTNSTVNIATTGSYQTTLAGLDDVFIVKFDAAGNRIWGTYFGGESAENPNAILYDGNGGIYAIGSSISLTGIATPGSYQENNAGGTNEGFIAKFDTSGARIWSTYFGGEGQDILNAAALDANGNIGITGSTNSTTGIATIGSHQDIYGGGPGFGINARDAFIAVFTPAGNRLWATYYGGDKGDVGRDIAFDQSGNIYICGNSRTLLGTAIATPGSHQPIPVAVPEAFLAKFDNNGVRQWGTYYGDVGNQEALAVVCDANNNVYIGGYTADATLGIATPGSHQDTMGSAFGNDGFLVKFNTDGTRQWGTYYGGEGSDRIESMLPVNNEIYICGSTESLTNISTPDGLQPVHGGGFSDVFLVRFDTLGVRKSGTYYGGIGDEYPNKISAAPSSVIHITGETNGTGAATANGFQPNFSGGASDAFLVQLGPDTLVEIANPFTDTALCQGASFTLNYTTTIAFQAGNIFTAQLSDALGSFATPTDIGNVIASASGSINCVIPTGTTPGTGFRVRVASSAPSLTSADNGQDITIGQQMNVTVSITANPSGPINTGTSVTFNAAIMNGGTTPAYQWKKNSADITGATNDTYTTNALSDNDNISVSAISDLPCAQPDTAVSNTLTINMIAGIAEKSSLQNAIKIHPNPNTGVFTISGSLANILGNTTVSLQLTDLYGRIVYQGSTVAKQGSIKQFIDVRQAIANGIYLLHVSTESGAEETIKCIVHN